MMQTTIKVLTLGFFISMITSFVVYRMGYFDPDYSANAMHTSPNGGELMNGNENMSDSTVTPNANKAKQPAIMPSSKSIAPAFDLEEYQVKETKKKAMMSSSKSGPVFNEFSFDDSVREIKNPYMHSSKSLIFPIDIKLTPIQISESKRKELKVKPELVNDDSSSNISPKSDKEAQDLDFTPVLKSTKEETETKTKIMVINWGLIALGVLGVLFVGIGAIAYFKNRSK